MRAVLGLIAAHTLDSPEILTSCGERALCLLYTYKQGLSQIYMLYWRRKFKSRPFLYTFIKTSYSIYFSCSNTPKDMRLLKTNSTVAPRLFLTILKTILQTLSNGCFLFLSVIISLIGSSGASCGLCDLSRDGVTVVWPSVFSHVQWIHNRRNQSRSVSSTFKNNEPKIYGYFLKMVMHFKQSIKERNLFVLAFTLYAASIISR